MPGAQGQTDVPFGTEQGGIASAWDCESGDERPAIPAIANTHGPNSPSFGSAGGSDRGFSTRPGANPPASTPKTGLKDPALGG